MNSDCYSELLRLAAAKSIGHPFIIWVHSEFHLSEVSRMKTDSRSHELEPVGTLPVAPTVTCFITDIETHTVDGNRKRHESSTLGLYCLKRH